MKIQDIEIVQDEEQNLEVGMSLDGLICVSQSGMCCAARIEVGKIDELISILTRLKNGN